MSDLVCGRLGRFSTQKLFDILTALDARESILSTLLKMKNTKRIAVIGGGLVGLAVAHKILSKHPKVKLDLYEKEEVLAHHQSGRNSGVLHSGLYYEPDSLKAKLAVEGIKQMIAFCQEHRIPCDQCGKIVVATNKNQVPTIRKLAERGHANGIKGLKILTPKETRQREPNVKVEEALLVPDEGIVDYKLVASKLASLIQDSGGQIHLGCTISQVGDTANNTVIVQSQQGEKEYDYLVCCTGLFSDRTYQTFTNKNRPWRIVPFRGDYFELTPAATGLFNHLIYPVADLRFPFLGIHFTRTIDQRKLVGPNAVLAFKREGYRATDINISDIFDSLSYVGLIHFLRKHFKLSMSELASTFSAHIFVAKAKELIPDLTKDMLVRSKSGVRAQALSKSGALIMDFQIEKHGRQIHVLNAPSPAATASLAIGGHIVNNYLIDL